jgi:CheY-like chemotaxis protein
VEARSGINPTETLGKGRLELATRLLHGVRVLVVDDGVTARELTGAILGLAGAEVCFGRDGLEGLALASSRVFDAIVLDIEMPRMNGFEMTRHLRRMGVRTCIFALTSLRLSPDDPSRRNCRFSGWLEKPLHGDSLVLALSSRDRCAIGPEVQQDMEEESRKSLAFDVTALASASPRILAVVLRFSEQLEPLLAEIEESWRRGDREALKAQLHRLRGSAGSCGFSSLMAAVERWEDALDDGSETDGGAVRFSELRRFAEEGRRAFQRFYETRRAESARDGA